MFRIDLATGELITPSGKKSSQQIHFIEAQIQEFEFTFIQDRKTYTIPENAILSIAGDVSEDNNSPIFYAEGKVADDRKSVKFFIDTYTEEYCRRVHASNICCFVDIYIKQPTEERNKLLVRFHALADAILYVEGTPPAPLSYYYKKSEIDELLKNADSNLTFLPPEVSTITLPPGEDAQAKVNISTENSQALLSFEFALPGGSVGTKGDPGEQGPPGLFRPPVEQIYFDETYGIVSYLDAENSLKALGFQAEAWRKIKMWICSANVNMSGNIVLVCGNNRNVFHIESQIQLIEWEFDNPVSGKVEIIRDAADVQDTLKSSSGNTVAAMVIDWGAY